jgi:uncharacterized delta-60 repeat protein
MIKFSLFSLKKNLQMSIFPSSKAILKGLLIALICFWSRGIQAQNILLDPGFTSVQSTNYVKSMACVYVYPDGRILIGGWGGSNLRLVRLLADGTADPTFIDTAVTSGGPIAYIKVQTDGKIIVAGSFTSIGGVTRNQIARLNSDGTLDTTFNAGTGPFKTDGTTVGSIRDIELLPDGRIIVGGQFAYFSGVSKEQMVWLNTDGSIDATVIQPNFRTANLDTEAVEVIKIAPDGSVIVAGAFIQPGSKIFRMTANGTVTQSNFTALTSSGILRAVGQPDGKIIVAGWFDTPWGRGIARYNVDGTLDAVFGANATGPSTNIYRCGLGIQSDGKIIIAGDYTVFNGTARPHITRLNTNGTLDATYTVGTGFTGGNFDKITNLAVQPDNKVIVVGDYTGYNGTTAYGVSRLLDCQMPPTGAANQAVCGNGTLASLTVAGVAIKWYNAASAGTLLPGTTPLVNGTTYYATQTTACESTSRLAVTVTINSLPTASLTVGGTTSICYGTGTNITIASSQLGVNYQLKNGATNVGTAVAGTGGTINLPTGNLSVNSTFNVVATNPTTTCTAALTGTATITINPLPTANLTVGGAASICSGTGTNITIANSQLGINYQLKNGPTSVGSPVAGTGGTINLPTGNLVANSTFGVVATNATTTCTATLTNTAIVTVISFPTTSLTVGGGTTLCSGTATNITVALSQAGVNYQLKNGATDVGSSISGTGGTINLPTGNLSATTTFNVLATTATASCIAALTGTATVTVTPLPAAPIGATPQTLCNTSAKISDLVATGSSIKWYDASTAGTLLIATTALTNGTTYYASQTVNSCESAARFPIVTSLIPCQSGVSFKGNATTNANERLDRYGRIGNPLEYVALSGKTTFLGAHFTMTASSYTFLSVYDTDYLPETAPLVPATLATNQPADGIPDPTMDIAGILTTTGITIPLPYVATQTGTIAAYKSTLVIPASYTEDGLGRTIEFSFPAQTIFANGAGNITATLKSLNGNLNLKKLDVQTGVGNDGKGFLLGNLNYPTNNEGGTATFEVRVIAKL